jgi:ketosteroid isomerase-like protein
MITLFFERLNNRDQENMAALLDPEARFYFPKTKPLLGKKQILRFFDILFRRYPRLTFKVERIITQGNHTAVHWTNEGANRNQTPYRNEGVTLMEIRDGKIIFMSDFFKDTEKF